VYNSADWDRFWHVVLGRVPVGDLTPSAAMTSSAGDVPSLAHEADRRSKNHVRQIVRSGSGLRVLHGGRDLR